MIDNAELDLAWNFVEKTDRNIFLTGKAGTGKTTFLHKIRNESFKRNVIVAPTGVAAINAKGVTIHSFFQMAFGPILPEGAVGYENNKPSDKKFNRKKIDIIRSLDLLIIDEISMVRADLLDGIDQVLRRYKNKDKVFGGVQILMIGDLQQLSPVVKPNEWQLLQAYYKTAYFFSSRAFQESNPIGIELKHIYRQKNKAFINILNEIRNNKLTDTSLNELNKRYIENFSPTDDDGYITLTTHNNQADSINSSELNKLKTKTQTAIASIDGDFPEHTYPTHFRLELKVGAQVMFIKNDSSFEKRYYNGKIGKIVRFEGKKVVVQCPNDVSEIIAEPEKWDNINFTLNSTTKEIEENIKGSFSQIPLRLAWAITIHKSQGLTFDKAIIDVTSSFAHGQTYVALSRCKTLDGIVLKRPIDKRSIIQDTKVISFTKTVEDNPPTNNDLDISKKNYQLNLINELFNYRQLFYPVNRCSKAVYNAGHSLKGNISAPLKIIKDNGLTNLAKIGDGFKNQLAKMSIDISNPETDNDIQERINKGINYFIEQTNEHIIKQLEKLTYSTDNKEINKEIKEQLKRINEFIEGKLLCFNGLKDDFSTDKYLKLRADAALIKVKGTKTKRDYSDKGSNPKLFSALRQLRHRFAEQLGIDHFQIFTQETLYEMCDVLPVTEKQLRKIKGMGKIRIQKYGFEILEIIKEYCEESNIEIVEAIDEPKKKPKDNTKEITYNMFKDGISISEIAIKRELVEGTIQGHLAHYIKTGTLSLSDIIGAKKANSLIHEIKQTEFENSSDLKAKLNDKYSYGELRMALNAIDK